jgi:hypothetical protein
MDGEAYGAQSSSAVDLGGAEEGARRMLEEPDPKADELWEEVVAGFYGEERPRD